MKSDNSVLGFAWLGTFAHLVRLAFNPSRGVQMISWGLRITTFITNSAVLVAYAFLYSWLLHTDKEQIVKYRSFLLGTLSWAALLLFHFASVLSMADAKNPTGFGWNYMNLQLCVILFALIGRPPRHVVISLIVLLTIWYWWMPRVGIWIPLELATIALMCLFYHFSKPILHHLYLFFPFSYLFALPFYVANLISLDGIDVGWAWLLFNYAILTAILWIMQKKLRENREHQAMLVEEASIDELTQLHNFRVFDDDLQNDYRRMQVTGKKFALYTFDIDHLKHVNDQYGHLVGNDVLHAVAKRLTELSENFPYETRCYRTGGEEFTLIMTDITENFGIAVETAKLIQNEIHKLHFTAPTGEEFQIAISLGQDRSLADDQNYLDVYNRADKYLYSSKNKGRDRITVRGITI
jgi:diguanylate cyclase (GGDEF)-like protein